MIFSRADRSVWVGFSIRVKTNFSSFEKGGFLFLLKDEGSEGKGGLGLCIGFFVNFASCCCCWWTIF